MINAGKYKRKIEILDTVLQTSDAGFQEEVEKTILSTRAQVLTSKGSTLIANGTDFEKAYTNFTIRYPKEVINRKMKIKYKGKVYRIDYINDVGNDGVELELQAILIGM